MTQGSEGSGQGTLEGIKVLDFGRFISAPYCAMLLGDLGADVVKVERPERGEDARWFQPRMANGQSSYVLTFNRNKRGIGLNLRSPGAQAVLRELCLQADVIVENFRPGTMEKMGCGYDTLSELNPGLVMVRISGFGQEGAYTDRRCTDPIAQAMSGLMQLTGDPDGPPGLVGTYISDYSTALYASIGATAALVQRGRTGKGQMVDVSLLDSSVSLLVTSLIDATGLGLEPQRSGNADRYATPGNSFLTGDGRWIHIVAGVDAQWEVFARLIGRDDLLADPRLNDVVSRHTHADIVDAAISEWIGALPHDRALKILDDADVQCALIASIAEVAQDPHLRSQGKIVDIDHPGIGSYSMAGITIGMTGSSNSIRRPAPGIGEHTDEVLTDWLGLDVERIAELHSNGAI